MPVTHPLRADDPSHLGAYRLLGCIGAGGQGVVYLAESPSGERVAVKAIHPRMIADSRAMERFVREVRTASSVAEFSTVRVLDAAVDDERPYVVSEYVDGPSLEQAVAEEGPYGPGALHRLAVSTAASLAAIHRAGVVHRDFKPGNVLIGPGGPQVIDFGIARALDSATSTTGGIGTPAYMSPEQLSGGDVGAASDVFSWAGTMVYAATGLPPFGRDFPAVLYRILQADPDLSALPADLRPLIARCLDKDPAARPAAPEMLMALVGADPVAGRPAEAVAGTAARPIQGASEEPVRGASEEAERERDGNAPVRPGGRPRAEADTRSAPGSAARPRRSRAMAPARGKRPPRAGRLPPRHLVLGAAVTAVVVVALVYVNTRPGDGTPGQAAQGAASSGLFTLAVSEQAARDTVAEWTPEVLEAAVPYEEGVLDSRGIKGRVVKTGDLLKVSAHGRRPVEPGAAGAAVNLPATLGKVFFRVGGDVTGARPPR
ncbi:protein kinase [Streptosporangium canum]|uniref:serine/threonine-protein kinase n=1 Tax=Streptosporangium canum TaxID=324952 RepID=UPI0034207D6C